jgi:hypothetical protein
MSQKEIQTFQDKWDQIIRTYNGNFRSNEKVDKFFSGQFYSSLSEKTQLNDNALPEPYLGDPYNCSVVCLNLNPGAYLPEFQNPEEGRFVTLGKAIEGYSEFAKPFPYLIDDYKFKHDEQLNGGHQWWEKRNEYFNRVFKYKGTKKPFALEICPWRSSSFGNIKLNKGFLEYAEEEIIDVASIVALNSDLNFVYSVGAIFRNLFTKMPGRFEKVQFVNQQNYKQAGYEYPLNGQNKPTNREISLWKDKNFDVIYINTTAQGSNKNPSPLFDKIIQSLISKHKI